MYIILVLFLARTLIYILTTPSSRFSVSKETVPSFFSRPRMSCCSFIAYSWSSMGTTALHRLLPLSMNISTNPLKFREIGLTIVPLKSLLFSIYELLLIAYKQSFFFPFCFPKLYLFKLKHNPHLFCNGFPGYTIQNQFVPVINSCITD